MEDKDNQPFLPRPWPTTPESAEELRKMLELAKETSDKFFRKALVDLEDLHKPVDI